MPGLQKPGVLWEWALPQLWPETWMEPARQQKAAEKKKNGGGRMERLTGEYKGRYGIKTPEGFMPAYEMASSDKSAESIAAFQEGIDRLALTRI